MALWGAPVDLPIQADSSTALPGLLVAVEQRGSATDQARWAARRARYVEAQPAQQQARAAALAELRSRRPIAAEWVGAAVAERLPAGAERVGGVVGRSGAVRRFLCRALAGR